jgi:hypothetical protein
LNTIHCAPPTTPPPAKPTWTTAGKQKTTAKPAPPRHLLPSQHGLQLANRKPLLNLPPSLPPMQHPLEFWFPPCHSPFSFHIIDPAWPPTCIPWTIPILTPSKTLLSTDCRWFLITFSDWRLTCKTCLSPVQL